MIFGQNTYTKSILDEVRTLNIAEDIIRELIELKHQKNMELNKFWHFHKYVIKTEKKQLRDNPLITDIHKIFNSKNLSEIPAKLFEKIKFNRI